MQYQNPLTRSVSRKASTNNPGYKCRSLRFINSICPKLSLLSSYRRSLDVNPTPQEREDVSRYYLALAARLREENGPGTQTLMEIYLSPSLV